MSQHSNSSTHDDHNRRKLGDTGEQIVTSHLTSKGFFILEKNYRKRFGEIDIIARKNDILAFVEVKLRKKDYFPLSQVVTVTKQRKIIKTAKTFILEHALYSLLYRFDVALITYDTDNQPNLTYIENAFTDTTRI